MKFTMGMAVRATQGFYFVQVVAVVASSGITVSGGDRLSMDRFPINSFPVMALDALGNNYALVLFPVGMGMDVRVTVGTHDTLSDVHTGIVFRILPLVTPFTLDFLDPDLIFHMPDEVGYVCVATGAGVLAMNRCCKLLD